jgi:thioredoxin reductase
MLRNKMIDVVVIGSGAAGLAAAAAANDEGVSVCVVEREERPGGILKQCVHDGFGLVRFGERLTGPEYAARYLAETRKRDIPILLSAYVTDFKRGGRDSPFILSLLNPAAGRFELFARAVVFATGCRERSASQAFIHGTRPSGVYTAGLAQYFVNIQGYLPGKRPLILGSGDIGLIMARRFTLEGARVAGVYEIKPEPSGLLRNVEQCLSDYSIPLHLSSTVTKVHGRSRVEGVSVARVGSDGRPIAGTEEEVTCDSLILSVGLIPENDLLGTELPLSKTTRGPEVDQGLMTRIPGVFSCGNSLHVSDLVDYVSESGAAAGRNAARFCMASSAERVLVPVKPFGDLAYVVPQYLSPASPEAPVFFFRPSRSLEKARLSVRQNGVVLYERLYRDLRPPEMKRLSVDRIKAPEGGKELEFRLQAE